MGFDDEHGSGSLESDPSFYSDNGIADVAVASDAVGRADFLNILYGCDAIFEWFAVNCRYFSFLESDFQQAFFRLFHLFEVSLFGQSLGGVEKLSAADAGSPDADIIAVFQFGEVCLEPIFLQIIYLFLSRKGLVAGEGDNLHSGRHHHERHVEAYLVVAGTRTAVGDGIGIDFFGVSGNGNGLKNALAGHGDGIAVVAQHVAENHVFQRLLIIFLSDVKCHVVHSSQSAGILLIAFELFVRKPSGVGTGGIHLMSLFRQSHDRIGGVETAAESNYYLFLSCCHNHCRFFV